MAQNISAAPADVEAYVSAGWWEQTQTLSNIVRDHASERSQGVAYRWGDAHLTWGDYSRLSDEIASQVAAATQPGDRVLVYLPDGGAVHAAYLGCERAGAVAVGVGWRAGAQELKYLVERSGARLAIVPHETTKHGPGRDLAAGLGLPSLVVGQLDGVPELADQSFPALGPDGRSPIGPSDLWLLNSTSGTTGLPKCVMQTQNRWFYFHQKAVDFGELQPGDEWMSVVPTPFGFGLWTAHVTPSLLGSTCHVQARFDPAAAALSIQEHRITVLCAVSTQFVMILEAATDHDLSSLNAVFTGGEAISPTRAAELEERSGCKVLNFYGSNETGLLSGTQASDPPARRYSTGGRVVPEMQVRLYDHATGSRVADHGTGQPAAKGPALALGYWDDDDANKQLQTPDGWFLMGDLVDVDAEGYLTVVGRTSDIIIRGGKNISAVAVEQQLAAHPAVVSAAVVGAPDARLGETAVAFVQLRDGQQWELTDMQSHLGSLGVSIEWWPERLVVLDALPTSSGGKIAKGELRELAAGQGS